MDAWPDGRANPGMNDSADQIYERVLVVRGQAGDDAALAELIERYQPRLQYYLRKMLAGSSAAEDAAQDVWYDVVRALPRLANPGAFRAWLYRIARDRAWRILRRRSPPRVPIDEIEVAANGTADDFTAEDVARVHAALDQLAPEHREVVVLRFVEDMNYDEIARVAGCPLGTVRSRLHHAKRALRRALEGINHE
jgi:RNA polymerase sigma-70 factor (ECF subfamily)